MQSMRELPLFVMLSTLPEQIQPCTYNLGVAFPEVCIRIKCFKIKMFSLTFLVADV